eukprot:Gb_33107 [translate_table: standard]
MTAEEDGKQKGSTILVAVKLGAASHEVLTWALVKVACPGDHVIALHVVTHSELSSKEQSNPKHQLANTFDSVVGVYEGFCNLKQVDLHVKISCGCSVRKVLVDEAKLYRVSNLILGASKHNALGSPFSLAKYCVKKLPHSSSVLVVDNGKVVFEKYATHHVSGAAVAPQLGLLHALRWGKRSRSCKILNNNVGHHLSIAERPSDAAMVSSSSSFDSAEYDNSPGFGSDSNGCKTFPIDTSNGCKYNPSEMEAIRSCLSLRPGCPLCTSNIHTLAGKEKKHVEHEARDLARVSSSDSFQTVSSTSGQVSQGEEESGTCTSLITRKTEEVSALAVQRGESPPGWPLLHRAISLNKVPSPRSTARQMSVVEWALRLPNRHVQITGELPVKEEMLPKVCSQHHEAQPLLHRAISLNKVPSPRSTEREMSVVEWALRLPNRHVQITGELPVKEETLHKMCSQHHEAQPSSAEPPMERVSRQVGFHCNKQEESESVEYYLKKQLEIICENKTCRPFTYQELQSATSGFSAENFVGRGGWSQVYRGFLSDGQCVAVKILNPSPEGDQELLLEVEIVITLKHKHIVSLIGYCVEGQNRLLVYNFVYRGNLEENLHGGKDKAVLPWTERLKIAVGVADALSYLHDGCSRSVIHRDVKSSNILLSEDFEPQLSDFGLARWAPMTSSHITCSDVVGTFGYLAPEYFVYGKVNEKTDVYSFGVVLLELITGKKPINTRTPKGQESLVMWARVLLENGSIRELADPHLEETYDTNEMQRMMLAAALCVRQAAHLRPRMSRILKLLRGEEDITDCARCQPPSSNDIDTSDEDDYVANQGDCDIQTHLALAMLGVDDDMISLSSMDHSVDLSHAKKSMEDYLRGRCSRSSSFD